MDAQLAHELLKKDPDMTIEPINDDPGMVVIKTTMDLEAEGVLVRQGPQLTDLIDGDLLEREAHRRLVPVEIRMVRFVFAVQMITALLVATLGYLMYYVFSYDESRTAALWTWVGCSVLLIGLYAALVAVRAMPDFIIGPCMLAFVLCAALWIGALGALLRNMITLQACASIMCQSCAVYAYSLDASGRQRIDPWHAAGYMGMAHLVAWLVGVPVFARQHDWAWAMVLLLFGLLHVAYATWQLYNIDRYCLSQRDRVLALLHYYIDPVVQLMQRDPK